MQEAIVEFDKAQRDIQGGLRLVDVIFFPTGTIVASGDNCSEQGSGRWLPKPSDTFNKFILMLNRVLVIKIYRFFGLKWLMLVK